MPARSDVDRASQAARMRAAGAKRRRAVHCRTRAAKDRPRPAYRHAILDIIARAMPGETNKQIVAMMIWSPMVGSVLAGR